MNSTMLEIFLFSYSLLAVLCKVRPQVRPNNKYGTRLNLKQGTKKFLTPAKSLCTLQERIYLSSSVTSQLTRFDLTRIFPLFIFSFRSTYLYSLCNVIPPSESNKYCARLCYLKIEIQPRNSLDTCKIPL